MMFTIQIGNTSIHFLPLIVILIIGFALAIIHALFHRKRCLSMIANCQSGAYDKVIVAAPKLLQFYQKNIIKRICSKKTIQHAELVIENANICLAVSYLGLSKHDLFLSHIHQVTKYQDTKNFWLSVYYWLENDMKSFKATTEKIEINPETEKSLEFLTGLRLYKEGNTEEAIAMLNSVLPNLRFVFLKNMVHDIAK